MHSHSAQQEQAQPGIVWIKLAVLYLVVGVAIGIGMGASQDFTLRPIHAHVNLLGWATLAISGLIYTVFPQTGTTRLARIHFWLLNLALPLMMGSLAYVLLTGDVQILPALVIAEISAAVSILAMTANIFLNLQNRKETAAAGMAPDVSPRGA
ncbi:cytochrome-c oxidase [Pseudoduganella lutea]|uniref:Cytochrome-c oxidase n=1 Tax=Pseudoduganella lutea TaxID=321985 RepID=A0A4P6L0R1_9BURK|nr:cytochrome-c oxidase [Pseudoduganella lutea]QBE64472.1 cytochrome-c oxidase [Pseudoduganella lutea]